MKLPPKQEAIRAKCFHPLETFIEFSEAETEQSIIDRFEKIVRQNGNRLAVKLGDESLTYEELNRAANRVGHAILKKCGDQIHPVMVLADQSVKAIVACLGVLKAGKILVATDPSFPVDRLNNIADDSNSDAILAFGHNHQTAANLTSKTRWTINLDTLSCDLPTANPGIRRSALDPAIIRYTSGSTGKPKGVLRNHRKTLHTYRARINASHLCPQDRKIILRRLSFSVTDAFSALMAGASVFPYDINEHGLHLLGGFLNTEEITYFVATPSLFRHFAQELDTNAKFPCLRVIQLGGEPLFRSDIDHYKRQVSANCSLLNQYASSEMGTVCQLWIGKESNFNSSIVPAGYPVDGKKIVLLDEERNEVSSGQTGEIAVTSRNLSTGYWNNSELTNDKFLPSKVNLNERLYISGDLGQLLPDGCLLYIGRKDDQVKIRGAKVEIPEIEATLSEHPQIKQVAIVAFDHDNGDKYLAAYIVPQSGSALNTSEINSYLRLKLPDYMIPSVVKFLEVLPLKSGKLDRKGLPQPNRTRPDLSTRYVAPRTKIEAELMQIWQYVLSLDAVGVHDNFFDVGGHSLAATRVVSRAVKQYQLEITLHSLFNSPTIADMAAVITKHQGKALDKQGVEAVLDELESLSDEGVEQLLGKQYPDISKP